MSFTGQNITMYRGDSKVLYVTNYRGSAFLDLSGGAVNYVIYKMSTGVVVLTKTTVSGVSFFDPTNGIMEIELDPIDTEPLFGLYAHECEFTDTLGNISTLFTGKVTILDSKA